MKFKQYIIEHTKERNGDDSYTIKKVYFGFIKIGFSEPEISHGIRNEFMRRINKCYYKYRSMESAKKSLDLFIEEPRRVYRGITLYRAHNDQWYSYVNSELASTGNFCWTEYEIAGDFDFCKGRIDRYLQEKENKKFKEIIKL